MHNFMVQLVIVKTLRAMKQIFLYSLIFFQCTCYAQVVNDYLINAEWHLFYTCEPEQSFFQNVDLEFKTGSDTLISGFIYKKVQLDNQSHAQFFLRQDSSKIYYRSANPSADSIEFEVYDFSIEQGEDYVYEFEYFQNNYAVSVIDSIVLQDGTKRKRITFSDPYNIGCAEISEISQWIEGIGGKPGSPLYFFEDYCWCEYRGFTFLEDDVLLYKSDLLIDNIKESQKINFEYRQSENQMEILSDFKIDRLIIYGIDGRSVTEVEDSQTIQIDYLSSGIYILEVVFRNHTQGTIKFLK